MNGRGFQIFLILMVLLLAYIGFSMVLPLFPILILDPDYTYLSPQIPAGMRNLLLGLLIAMFPLGQLFGSPCLGQLSDHFGRRRILLVSLFSVIPAFAFSGIGILSKSLWLIYVSRFAAGLFEANVVVALASMSDWSEKMQNKAASFGWVLSFSALGFVIGPLVGGPLAKVSLWGVDPFATPFFTASALSLCTFLLVLWKFQETLELKDETFAWRQIVHNLIEPLKSRLNRSLYFGNLWIYVGMFFFFAFFPALLYRKFGFGPVKLGLMDAYMSFFITIAPITFRKLTSWISLRRLLGFGSLLFTISMGLLLLFLSIGSLFWTLILSGYVISLLFASAPLNISEHNPPQMQGVALGLNQSVQVFAEILAATLGGILASVFIELPFLVAMACGLIASIWVLTLQLD